MRDIESIQGVSLVQYAAIKAALAEPFPVPEVLAIEGVAPSAWQAADLGWKERLVPDALASGPLFAAYSERLAAAEDRLSRRVTPLDDDPGAWVAFLHAMTTSGDVPAILDRAGLGPNDASRLSRRWSARTAADAALARRVRELAGRPGPLPPVSAEPAKLVPSRAVAARPRTLLLDTTPSSSPALPFTQRAVPAWSALASAMEHAEATQGPASTANSRAGGTLLGAANVSDLLGGALPFAAPGRAPSGHRPASSPPSPRSASMGWSVEQHASLHVELHLYPDRHPHTLARYGLTPEARAALDASFQARFTAETGIRAAWERAYAQYRGHLLSGAGPARG